MLCTFDTFCAQRMTRGNSSSAILKTRSRLTRTTAVKMRLPRKANSTRRDPEIATWRSPSPARQPLHLDLRQFTFADHTAPTNSDPVNLNYNALVVVLDDVRLPMHNCDVEEIFSKPDVPHGYGHFVD